LSQQFISLANPPPSFLIFSCSSVTTCVFGGYFLPPQVRLTQADSTNFQTPPWPGLLPPTTLGTLRQITAQSPAVRVRGGRVFHLRGRDRCG
jgi:hypothetical protein